ncbi:MAG: class II aldolase/adducin family protein [Gemmatimonadetes bacterium]|nr:class II aldolase/adducin family protein [Gemmatimonadota bacterium]
MTLDDRGDTSHAEAVEQVALACRIIAAFGYEDLTLGHVSLRPAGDDRAFIKRKGVALGEVTPGDVIDIYLDDPDCLTTPGMHLEAAIHVEVYRSRPDVGAVIHGHPLYATALSATSTDSAYLEFLTHDSALFVDGLGIYDDSAELITTIEQGKAVADALERLDAGRLEPRRIGGKRAGRRGGRPHQGQGQGHSQGQLEQASE